MGQKFQTPQLKQCTEHFCVLYSTAFCSKSQVPIMPRQCICVGLSWFLFAIFHPGCHLPNCITQVLTPCHPKPEVTSKSCCETADARSVLCNNNARQIRVSQVTDCSPSPPWLHSIASTTALQRGVQAEK